MCLYSHTPPEFCMKKKNQKILLTVKLANKKSHWDKGFYFFDIAFFFKYPYIEEYELISAKDILAFIRSTFSEY